MYEIEYLLAWKVGNILTNITLYFFNELNISRFYFPQ